LISIVTIVPSVYWAFFSFDLNCELHLAAALPLDFAFVHYLVTDDRRATPN
jgi:hypothetical protein